MVAKNYCILLNSGFHPWSNPLTFRLTNPDINSCHVPFSLFTPHPSLFFSLLHIFTESIHLFRDRPIGRVHSPSYTLFGNHVILQFFQTFNPRRVFSSCLSFSFSVQASQHTNPCIWHSIYFPYAQEIPKVTHQYSSNPRSFLLSPIN